MQTEVLQTRLADLTGQHQAAQQRAEKLENVTASLREENAALTRRLTEALTAAAAADARAESAETRYTQLLDALSDPARFCELLKGSKA
jgi:chromosome segregation ATPase